MNVRIRLNHGFLAKGQRYWVEHGDIAVKAILRVFNGVDALDGGGPLLLSGLGMDHPVPVRIFAPDPHEIVVVRESSPDAGHRAHAGAWQLMVVSYAIEFDRFGPVVAVTAIRPYHQALVRVEFLEHIRTTVAEMPSTFADYRHRGAPGSAALDAAVECMNEIADRVEHSRALRMLNGWLSVSPWWVGRPRPNCTAISLHGTARDGRSDPFLARIVHQRGGDDGDRRAIRIVLVASEDRLEYHLHPASRATPRRALQLVEPFVERAILDGSAAALREVRDVRAAQATAAVVVPYRVGRSPSSAR